MKQKLTKRVVESTPVGAICWDTELRGFGVRSRKTGRDYVLKRRVRGQQRWFALGRHGEVTTEEARRSALAMLGDIARGSDPTDARRDSKATLTVLELCDIYLREGCSTKKQSTLSTDRGRIERHIKVLLGTQEVRGLRKADIEQFLNDVAAGKTATTSRPDIAGAP